MLIIQLHISCIIVVVNIEVVEAVDRVDGQHSIKSSQILGLRSRNLKPAPEVVLVPALKRFFSVSVVSTDQQRDRTGIYRAIAAREGKLPEVPPTVKKAIVAYLGENDVRPFLRCLSRSKEKISSGQHALELLNHVKSFELKVLQLGMSGFLNHRSTYELRTLCLQHSKGVIPSFVAYTYSLDKGLYENPFSAESWKYASDPRNYIPRRQALLHRLLVNGWVKELAMSRRFLNPKKTVYCLGGNTATGKSYWAKKDAAFQNGILNGEAVGALNPDTMKAALRQGIPGVTNQQIHVEGAVIFNQLIKEILSKSTKGTLLFDERFARLDRFRTVVDQSVKMGADVFFKEVDAPLIVSCARVLTRDIKDEPVVPFGVVAGGFKALRKNRSALIDAIREGGEVNYQLFVVDEEGNGGVAMSVTGGDQKIVNKELLALAKRIPQEKEISELETQVIDDAFIKRMSKVPGVDESALHRFKGLTLGQAMERHARELPMADEIPD